MAVVVPIESVARKRTYYLLDATSTWDSTTKHNITVPDGLRWKVIVATIKNSASQTSAIYWVDDAATPVVIAQLEAQGANTGRTTWSEGTRADTHFGGPLIMDAGEELQFEAGGAQGAAAYIYVHVLEWGVDPT